MVSINNQFKHLSVIIYYALVIVAGAFYFSNSRYGFFNFEKILLISLVTVLIFFVPQLMLHLNYYFTNKGDVFIYNPVGQRITIIHKGESVSFLFRDIELIKRYKSFPLAEKRMQWFPWDSYNYSIIYLKGGKEFVVTSLLVPNMDLPIDSNKVKLYKVFYKIID